MAINKEQNARLWNETVEVCKKKMEILRPGSYASSKEVSAVIYTHIWEKYTLRFLVALNPEETPAYKSGIHYGIQVCTDKHSFDDTEIDTVIAECNRFRKYLESETGLATRSPDNTDDGICWVLWISLGELQDISVAIENLTIIYRLAKRYFKL